MTSTSDRARIAVVFPGQASQQVGMGLALCEASARAREVYALADEVSGLPVAELACRGSLEELTRTEHTQLAVVATSLAAAAVLEELLGHPPQAVATAGHSVGELAAMAWAGALSLRDTLALVRERGRLMERDSATVEGAMAAVFGLSPEQLEPLCAAASEHTGARVQIANLNAPDQVVLSGARPAVQAAVELARASGAQRAVPLNVGGPFHSIYMELAARDFAAACSAVPFRPPRAPIVLNTTAEVCADPDQLRQELSSQIVRPVRWSESVHTLAGLGCSVVVELGPGRVLTNLVRRTLPELKAISAGTPEALAEAAALWR